MNLKLIYFSPTGTTKSVVEAIAMGLEMSVEDAIDLTQSTHRDKELVLSEDDLVIVGLPVYAGRIPQFLIPSLEKIKGNGAKAVCVVVYGNREYDDALLELKNMLEASGLESLAAGAFIGEHSYTSKVANQRPDQKDLVIAKNFGEKISQKLNLLDDLKTEPKNFEMDIPELRVKGDFPYKPLMAQAKFAPVTNDACIDCGICVRTCPMDAINPDDVRDIDADKCIRCCSCIKKCPTKAKHFDNEMIDRIINMLETNLSKVRKDVELFM